MNIAEILQHCPKGMALYSPLFGECKLVEASPQIGIRVKMTDENGGEYVYSFNIEGIFCPVRGAECLLFPSKSQRDWSLFRLPVKNGDIMMTIDGSKAFIVKGEKNGMISVYCGIDIYDCLRISDKSLDWAARPYIPASDEAKQKLFDKLAESGYKWKEKDLMLEKIESKIPKNGDILMTDAGRAFIATDKVDKDNCVIAYCGINSINEFYVGDPNNGWTASPWTYASKDAAKVLFDKMQEAGYRWNAIELKLEKRTECLFKPFDKVLVRDGEDMKWYCNFFSSYNDDIDYPYSCIDSSYRNCIPYEGNEHLLGTTNSPELGATNSPEQV